MSTSEPRRVALTLVSDRQRLAGRDLAALAAEAAAAGIDWLQLREKDLPAGPLLQLAREMARAAQGSPLRVLVNSRPDVAEAAGCAGVQLPEHGLGVAAVRGSFPELVIGASCHDLEAARRAAEAGADFVMLGPVYPTRGKPRALGLEELRRIAAAVSVPVHAIGGLRRDRVAAVVAAGASGLAAIDAFHAAPVAETVARWRAECGA